MKQQWKIPNDFRVKRQLRFFQEQRTGPFEDGPEKADQAKRSVGELLLSLPCTLWAPMLVLSTEMRRSSNRVPPEFEILQLRHGDLERFADPPQPGATSLRRAAGDLFEKIATVGVVLVTHGAIGLPDELRDYVQIAYGSQELNDLTKPPIHIDLFEVCLRQPLGVGLVISVRPRKQILSILSHPLVFEDGAPQIVLGEADFIFPEILGFVVT